jgi:NADH-quinone oxidoreductase subunit L
MLELLFIVPCLPYAAALLFTLAGKRMPRAMTALIGAGSVGVAAAVALWISAGFITSPPPGRHYVQHLWTWWRIGSFQPAFALYLDAVSLVWMLVITVVGFLILLYATADMWAEDGYRRFFGTMDLFIGSMLILVLADNLVLLYLGWEGVGLCSYLLIGFWYKDPQNGYAARKAFVMTRVGDVALLLGLFLLFTQLDTLNIQELMTRARQTWPAGSFTPMLAAGLLLGGAVGKSAQLPLQSWLVDAMAGPSPVSALIHAATMVTSGVYLIARTHVLYTLAPPVMFATAVLGAATLLLAGFSGLVQTDIKRVLAYSTISQIGYMILAMGVGAWIAGVFHFMIHAFFKALLFLGAGAVIHVLGHERNLFKMGGLRKQLPLTFWTFLIGSGALSAVPLVTAGFYSKDLIIWQALASERGNVAFWIVGIIGAFLTSMYTFRMVFLTFFGPAKTEVRGRIGLPMQIPLVVLAALSLAAGFLQVPPVLGNLPAFADFMHGALPATVLAPGMATREGLFTVISAIVSLWGIFTIYVFIIGLPRFTAWLVRTPLGDRLYRFWLDGWGFDWVYDCLLVRPYVFLAHLNRNDGIDRLYQGIALLNRLGNRGLTRTQSGQVRWYATGFALGAVVIIGLAVFL